MFQLGNLINKFEGAKYMEKIVIWGASKYADELVSLTKVIFPEFENKIDFYVDNSKILQGGFYKKKKVISYKDLMKLAETNKYLIIICTNSYEEIINNVGKHNNIKLISYIDYYFENLKKKYEKYFKDINDIGFEKWLNNRIELTKATVKNKLEYYDQEVERHIEYHILKKVGTWIYALYSLYNAEDKSTYSKVIAINGRTPSRVSNYFSEMSMAYILAKNGVKVNIFRDDLTAQHYIDNQKKSGNLRTQTIRIIQHIINIEYYKIIFEHKNLILKRYSELNLNRELIENYSTQKHSISNLKRILKTDVIDLNDKKIIEMYEERLIVASFSWKLGKYIEENINPDIFITSHAIYSSYGPCFDYLKESGYDCVVYEECGHLPQHIAIENNCSLIIANQGSSIKNSMNKVIDETIINNVDNYMEQRLNLLARDNSSYYLGRETFDEESVISKILKFKDENKLFVAFPNVVYDGAEKERDIAFNGVSQWIKETIEYFENNDVGKLVIRFHPAEKAISMFSEDKGLYELLQESKLDMDGLKNVLFINSDTPFNSYKFKDIMDVGIMYSGTVGFEFPFMGKSMISVGNGRCSYPGVNYVIKDKEDYFKIINEISKNEFSIDIDMESVYKFINWYIFDMNYYYPFTDGVYEVTFLDKDYKLDLEVNSNLKITIDRLLNKISE